MANTTPNPLSTHFNLVLNFYLVCHPRKQIGHAELTAEEPYHNQLFHSAHFRSHLQKKTRKHQIIQIYMLDQITTENNA